MRSALGDLPPQGEQIETALTSILHIVDPVSRAGNSLPRQRVEEIQRILPSTGFTWDGESLQPVIHAAAPTEIDYSASKDALLTLGRGIRHLIPSISVTDEEKAWESRVKGALSVCAMGIGSTQPASVHLLYGEPNSPLGVLWLHAAEKSDSIPVVRLFVTSPVARGIGAFLVEAAVQKSAEMGGAGKLRVNPVDGSERAYEALGFKELPVTSLCILDPSKSEKWRMEGGRWRILNPDGSLKTAAQSSPAVAIDANSASSAMPAVAQSEIEPSLLRVSILEDLSSDHEVYLKQLADGRKVVHKSFEFDINSPEERADVEARVRRELFAYQLSEALGLDLVPETLRVARTNNQIVYAYVNGAKPPAADFDISNTGLQVFDYLINMIDRRSDSGVNNLVIDSTGRFYAIDHESILHPNEEDRSIKVGELSPNSIGNFFADAVTQERFLSLDWNRLWTSCFGSHIEDARRQEFMSRVELVKNRYLDMLSNL
ncbi:hypothetical protein C7H84_36085 [Burkholderia sp. Nafp2/4-1b]|nr:hypothetical protein C7H84_36085 [Burkholderia sp. Nafp2/4-1b]